MSSPTPPPMPVMTPVEMMTMVNGSIKNKIVNAERG
jgi:hypothetical protein